MGWAIQYPWPSQHLLRRREGKASFRHVRRLLTQSIRMPCIVRRGNAASWAVKTRSSAASEYFPSTPRLQPLSSEVPGVRTQPHGSQESQQSPLEQLFNHSIL
jgi:hypothetical protein